MTLAAAQIFAEGIVADTRIFYYRQEQNPETYIYLHGLSDSSPGDLPVVIAPRAEPDGRWIMGLNDGSVLAAKPEYFAERMQAWREFVGR